MQKSKNYKHNLFIMWSTSMDNTMTILALSVLGVSALVTTSFILYCCCWNKCVRRQQQQETPDRLLEEGDERSPLLSSSFRSRYLKRTSTFYQWNRPAPPSPSSSSLSIQNQQQQQPQHQYGQQHTDDDEEEEEEEEDRSVQQKKRETWLSRRKELLKKYARSPSFVTTSSS